MSDSDFDELTKKLSSPISRRSAFKAVLATAVGGALSFSGMTRAFAACKQEGDRCEHDFQCCAGLTCPPGPGPGQSRRYCTAAAASCDCGTGGTCFTGFANCMNDPNCFCYQTAEGGSGCGPSVLCAGAQTCTTSADCPSGSFCATNTGCNCGVPGGVCITCCTGALRPAPATGGLTSALT